MDTFGLVRGIQRIGRCLPILGLTAVLAVGCGGSTSSPQELFELGKEHQAAGRLDEALLAYTDTIQADPTHVAAHVNRGNTKLQLGAIDGALIDYKRALELEPDHFGAIFNSGIIQFLNGDFASALENYNRAIELNPEGYDTYVNRGTLHYAMGSLEEAINDYTLVIERGSNPNQAYSSRGNAYFDKGDYERALADYANAETSPFTPFRQWLAYRALGRPSDAERALENYVAKMSQLGFPPTDDTAAIHGFLSKAYDEDKARAILDEFEQNTKMDAAATLCFYLGAVKVIEGDEAAAKAYFERGTKIPNLWTLSEYVSMRYALRNMSAPAE